MSTTQKVQQTWLDPEFWERLDRIEARHQRVQSEHETCRRGLERCREMQDSDLHLAWQRYCDVIAELERTTAEFETLRTDLR